MRTGAALRANIAFMQRDLNNRVSDLDEKIQAMTARYSADISQRRLFVSFMSGEEITCYSWTHEYSFLPGRECFVSLQPIKFMSKAYKGTRSNTGGDDPWHGFDYPDTIWLSAEEFTVRRLKGQI